jgi:hypothetical protein
MITLTRYGSQINGVNTSVIPLVTMLAEDFDSAAYKLTGYIYGQTFIELDTPVDGQSDLAAFKVAAIAAIEADFLERYEGRATLDDIDFNIAVDGLNVVASALTATIVFSTNEDSQTQFQNYFGLVFTGDIYLLANALGGTNTVEGIAAPTTLLAQQGRRPLQL